MRDGLGNRGAEQLMGAGAVQSIDPMDDQRAASRESARPSALARNRCFVLHVPAPLPQHPAVRSLERP
jgi:hypothetical protein